MLDDDSPDENITQMSIGAFLEQADSQYHLLKTFIDNLSLLNTDEDKEQIIDESSRDLKIVSRKISIMKQKAGQFDKELPDILILDDIIQYLDLMTPCCEKIANIKSAAI